MGAVAEGEVFRFAAAAGPDGSVFLDLHRTGGAFLGSETIVDGRFISEEELDWDSDDGIELREGLGRYWPEDAEDEVEA